MMDYNQQENNNINKNSVEYRWDGNSYRAVYNNGGNGTGDYYSQMQPESPKKPKKNKKGLKIVLSVLAIILSCALVSGGTLMGFMALLNDGKITITNTGTTNDPVFTINKLIESEKNNTTDTIAGTVTKLTESEVAEKVLPSIVLIENYQISSSSNGFYFPFSQPQSSGEVTPAGEGSGIIASADGYIITNAHVVEDATSLKVKTYSGETYEATLIGSDAITDLAVIKIEAENLPYAQFGSSDDLKVGEKVLTAGNPGGSDFGFSITVGYVSALNRTITSSDTGYSMDCIQTDAAVNPGNSGGALVNEYGMVIGIVSSKIVSESFEGLGFAIPIDTAQGIISDLKNYGYVKDRAAMGISGSFIDSVTARFYGLEAGWYVSEITNPSVSAAGIQKGDVITAIDDKKLTSSAVISEYLLTKKPGDTVTVSVSRALSNETFTATVTLIELKTS